MNSKPTKVNENLISLDKIFKPKDNYDGAIHLLGLGDMLIKKEMVLSVD